MKHFVLALIQKWRKKIPKKPPEKKSIEIESHQWFCWTMLLSIHSYIFFAQHHQQKFTIIFSLYWNVNFHTQYVTNNNNNNHNNSNERKTKEKGKGKKPSQSNWILCCGVEKVNHKTVTKSIKKNKQNLLLKYAFCLGSWLLSAEFWVCMCVCVIWCVRCLKYFSFFVFSFFFRRWIWMTMTNDICI